MITLIRESFQHMSWADASIWKVVSELPQGKENEPFHQRLYHIHATQYAFYQLWNKIPLDIPDPTALKKLAELMAWAKEYHRQWPAYLDRLDLKELDAPLTIPWQKHIEKNFGRTVTPCSLLQSIYQVTSHSSYHRGQLNIVLRQKGAIPPMVDFIVWIWLGKPAADWSITLGKTN